MATPPAPRRMVGVSLKMYFSAPKTLDYLNTCITLLHTLSSSSTSSASTQKIDIFFIPDFITLRPASALIQAHNTSSPIPLLLGAQDCFWEDSGAYTGEVSPSVLRSVGCSLVELGHAERRRIFGETDDQVARKARAVVRNGMVPLVCIGEVTDRGMGGVDGAVRECGVQVRGVLDALIEDESSKAAQADIQTQVVFAYEPVWAIGAAEPASAGYVVAVVEGLRRVCEEKGWGRDRVRFLYGGSAGPGTFEGMKGAVDGLFLGRFAHDVGNLERVIEEVGRGSE